MAHSPQLLPIHENIENKDSILKGICYGCCNGAKKLTGKTSEMLLHNIILQVYFSSRTNQGSEVIAKASKSDSGSKKRQYLFRKKQL